MPHDRKNQRSLKMKIKKIINIIIGTVLIILMTACSNNNSQVVQQNTASVTVDNVLQQGMNANVTQASAVTVTPTPAPKEIESNTASDDTEKYDVDLTALSSTMVYSEVYNMMVTPEEYIGKTIKMSGSFATFINEEDGRFIFGCVITDATACCAQGIEFELTDDYKYPDDYPNEGDMICVTGTFDTYQENQYTYCTLRNAKLL